ncbi:hypothetical protein Jann_3451 [Jannaschia sp. CCS1]|nr:hypothetical protein Jann_3451 [Jannaschia sp. CCS1]
MRATDGDIARLLDRWQACHCEPHETHLKFYEGLNFGDAIVQAAGAKCDASGKRHPHQYRLRKKTLLEVKRKLDAHVDRLQAASSFHDLYQSVRTAIEKIHGVGPLMLYDTSLRLAACLRIDVDRVYLQRGALEGAKNYFSFIGVTHDFPVQRSLPLSDFPHLRHLRPDQVENFLCVYKGRMKVNALLEASSSRC